MKNNIAFTLLATLIIGIVGATTAAVLSVPNANTAFAQANGNQGNNGNNESNNPPASHGTVKIDGGELDNLPNN